jgi:hypothetical protein
MPTKQIAPRLEALPAALGITRGEALLLVRDCPRVLTKQAGTVAAGWQELRRAASKRPEWRQQIGNLTAESVQGYAAQLMYPCGAHTLVFWYQYQCVVYLSVVHAGILYIIGSVWVCVDSLAASVSPLSQFLVAFYE